MISTIGILPKAAIGTSKASKTVCIGSVPAVMSLIEMPSDKILGQSNHIQIEVGTCIADSSFLPMYVNLPYHSHFVQLFANLSKTL